ncbi:uncharacterized protein TNCT_279381 [Trichonephila clavata]|uniref:Uncharacterized protein n=1 Tax=Trichonephila clavata TaxID=2740835 RepID=A0A8X6JM08_TRICU|nr:uncharacterized protein TNCT_279381 [Trichonephila clavata]
MNRISRHVHLLHVLAAASPAHRKAILKSATADQIKTICEICQNLLSGNIPTKNIKKLCNYKRVIRLLANRNVPISRKRKLFTTNRQVDGFLPLILPAVLSLLGGITGKERSANAYKKYGSKDGFSPERVNITLLCRKPTRNSNRK